MPFFRDIIGQDQGLRILRAFLERDQYPSALLFSGGEGIGKRTAAHAFAQALFCRAFQKAQKTDGVEKNPQENSRQTAIEPCGECLSCRKMMDKNHPDFSVIEPDGNTIKVDQIRAMEEKIIFKPLGSPRKVILIDPADKMNASAANSLLKTLEEPPSHAMIILIASRPASLPETVLSRCQKVFFYPLSLARLQAILMEKKGWTAEEALLVTALSDGRLREALSIELETAKALEAERYALVSEEVLIHHETLFEVAVAFSHDKEILEKALSYLMEWFRDVLVVHSLQSSGEGSASQFVHAWRQEALSRWAGRMSPEAVWTFLDDIYKIQMAQNRNLNRTLSLETLLLRLREKVIATPLIPR
ncbi:MAG: DNA polymerase III subunit delta' [Nitrospira sp.]|nr:DNA polymerase III subunit delta' [Candidatus Manganitrophaceae bacterium]HIL34468.1 DNA polymerase III subunit delta' [Candidatus Manganitrophaceae bacterium]